MHGGRKGGEEGMGVHLLNSVAIIGSYFRWLLVSLHEFLKRVPRLCPPSVHQKRFAYRLWSRERSVNHYLISSTYISRLYLNKDMRHTTSWLLVVRKVPGSRTNQRTNQPTDEHRRIESLLNSDWFDLPSSLWTSTINSSWFLSSEPFRFFLCLC